LLLDHEARDSGAAGNRTATCRNGLAWHDVSVTAAGRAKQPAEPADVRASVAEVGNPGFDRLLSRERDALGAAVTIMHKRRGASDDLVSRPA
jgi:hypothetical protein